MKLLPFLVLIIQLNAFAQKEEQIVRIQFIEDNDTFPDCKTLYFGNGRTKVVKQELPELDLPNTIPVNPLDLTFNNRLNFHSYAIEIKQFGSIEMDANQIVPYSRQDVIDLILATADSSQSKWLMHDEKYLWDHFKILHDAKPVPKLIVPDTGTVVISGPVNATYKILTGVFVNEQGFIRIEPMQYKFIPEEYRSRFDSVPLDKSTLDSLLKPFYFSNYEVTNGEYRDFINWVRDSIELRIAYQNLMDQDAALLLNCSKQERKELDISKRVENLRKFGLNQKNKKKVDERKWLEVTESMFKKRPTRYYTRRELNTQLLIYRQSEIEEISIYPDTIGFLIDELNNYGDFLGNLSWHPAYANYPVVNLNSEQIMAFCHWKQRQMNEEYASEGYSITIRPPTITEYEFALKSAIEMPAIYTAIDQSNDYFITSTRTHYSAEFSFYQAVDYNLYNLPKSKKGKLSGHPPSLHYKQWYRSNQSDSPVKFLNGNVSEFVLDEVTRTKWQHYNITSPFPTTNANFVLGSNYVTDVKTYTDDQYNAIFYKSALENGKSSPLVGFRLVYLVSPKPPLER